MFLPIPGVVHALPVLYALSLSRSVESIRHSDHPVSQQTSLPLFLQRWLLLRPPYEPRQTLPSLNYRFVCACREHHFANYWCWKGDEGLAKSLPLHPPLQLQCQPWIAASQNRILLQVFLQICRIPLRLKCSLHPLSAPLELCIPSSVDSPPRSCNPSVFCS